MSMMSIDGNDEDCNVRKDADDNHDNDDDDDDNDNHDVDNYDDTYLIIIVCNGWSGRRRRCLLDRRQKS